MAHPDWIELRDTGLERQKTVNITDEIFVRELWRNLMALKECLEGKITPRGSTQRPLEYSVVGDLFFYSVSYATLGVYRQL